MQSLWHSTEQVLRLFESYIQPDSPAEGVESAQSKQQQAALSSVLSKMLPLIEGFILVHAADFLGDKAHAAAAVTVLSSTGDGSSSPNHTSSSSGNIFQLSSQQALPGAKYRTSALFRRSHISLLSDTSDESTSLGNSSRLSFNRTASRTFRTNSSSEGVAALMGYAPGSRAHHLVSFVHGQKHVLNALIRAYPSLLEGSLEALIRISQLRSYLAFDNKRAYFYSQLKKRKQPRNERSRTIHLQVRRDNVFEDSFHQLRSRSPEEMKGRLVVTFFEEEGIDAGGLTREWFMLLSREIFNPNYCLFTSTADGATFQPNPLSNINTNHLDYFKFVGRVFGKAVVDSYLLDGHFTRYK
jgi:hypothetical protein